MLGEEAHERDLECGLLEHLRKFLHQLGVGFAFVGSQYPLTIGGEQFRIDLLLYHLKLRCYVVIDLKLVPFQPEFAQKSQALVLERQKLWPILEDRFR